jgi:hypothetical protein
MSHVSSVSFSPTFITDALSLPAPAIRYETSRRLASLFPGRVVETHGFGFDPFDLAGAGRCTLRPLEGTHAQMEVAFARAGLPPREGVTTGWLEVDWEGQRLHVLRLRVDRGTTTDEAWFLVGPTREVALGFFSAVSTWNTDVRPDVEVLVFEGGWFHKSASLHDAIRHASLDDLVLPGALLARIRTDFDRFFEHRALYDRYGVPWRRGVLFTGPPGNGKTHTIKALVNHLGKPCLYVRSFEGGCGDPQARIRRVFARARDTAPCVLVLEDLDTLVDDDTRSFFLNELDGFAENEGIVTIATTNHPEDLDPAIAQRPSRFDRRYRFELPEAAERSAYLERWARALAPEMRPSEAGVRATTEHTEGFSFAYLKELVVSSMIQWMDEMRPGHMDVLMSAETTALRAQMSAGETTTRQ